VPRVKRGTKRRASRSKTLDRASGYFLTKSKLHRAAQEAVERGLKFAYIGRRQKKRDFRALWIVRIGAGCRAAGMSYRFINGLKKPVLRRGYWRRGGAEAAFRQPVIEGRPHWRRPIPAAPHRAGCAGIARRAIHKAVELFRNCAPRMKPAHRK
jgi:ribosomal protein L20